MNEERIDTTLIENGIMECLGSDREPSLRKIITAVGESTGADENEIKAAITRLSDAGKLSVAIDGSYEVRITSPASDGPRMVMAYCWYCGSPLAWDSDFELCEL